MFDFPRFELYQAKESQKWILRAFRKLVEQAKADPEFFHNLVFAPDKALSSAKYLDKRAKQALQTINPESVVALAVGELQGCDNQYTCTCTNAFTCTYTCKRTIDYTPWV